MHVLPVEEGLPDLPEEGSTVKKDPSEEGEVLTPMSPTGASASGAGIGSANEQSTIKANKGMILRKVCPVLSRIHRGSHTLHSRSTISDTSNSSCWPRLREEEIWKSGIGGWRVSWRR